MSHLNYLKVATSNERAFPTKSESTSSTSPPRATERIHTNDYWVEELREYTVAYIHETRADFLAAVLVK